MDIEKLIEQLNARGLSNGSSLGYHCGLYDDAATALSTLQAENTQLRAYLEYEQEHANAYYEECGQWEAENEKLRAELEQVKLVRCKDCKMSRPGGLGYVWCGPTAMPLDGFCSNGQQKED